MCINSSRSRRGFTLIELLVVMLLLGLGLGVGLTVDFATSPQQQQQQTRLLANALELAAQEAVLDGATLGLDFFSAAAAASAYRFVRLEQGKWKTWQLPEADAVETLLPAGLIVTLAVEGQTLPLEPRVALDLPDTAPFAPEILLLPTRELSPFTLTLADADGNSSMLTADLMGRVRVDEDAPTPP